MIVQCFVRDVLLWERQNDDADQGDDAKEAQSKSQSDTHGEYWRDMTLVAWCDKLQAQLMKTEVDGLHQQVKHGLWCNGCSVVGRYYW